MKMDTWSIGHMAFLTLNKDKYMLFVLDDSLLLCLNSNSSTSLINNTIELLTLAHREGKHILTGSRRVLENILTKCSLSDRALAMIGKIKNEIPQFGRFHTEVRRYAKVVYQVTKTIEHHEDSRILYVPFDKIQDSSVIQKTILLSENYRDTILYLLFGDLFRMHARLSTICISAETRGGGGSEITTEYRNIQYHGFGLCFCLVDSDKKAPLGGLGEVAKKIMAIDNASLPMSEVLATRVRMIENYLSTKQLAGPSAGNVTRMNAWSFLDKVDQNNDIELRNYMNFKKGINLAEIYKLPVEDPVRIFWHEELVKLLHKHIIQSRPCLENGECNKDSSCICELMPGFGESILENTIADLQKMSIRKVDESLCSATRAEWLHVGHIVFSWCCARKRLTV
jgi:hypothetical protein